MRSDRDEDGEGVLEDDERREPGELRDEQQSLLKRLGVLGVGQDLHDDRHVDRDVVGDRALDLGRDGAKTSKEKLLGVVDVDISLGLALQQSREGVEQSREKVEVALQRLDGSGLEQDGQTSVELSDDGSLRSTKRQPKVVGVSLKA